MVLYMSSSFGLLGIQSHAFFHAEKAVQIHKLTTIFTKNGPRLLFGVKIVVILRICSALQAVVSFLA